MSTSHGRQRQGPERNRTLSLLLFFHQQKKKEKFQAFGNGQAEKSHLSFGKCYKNLIFNLGFLPADRFVAYRYRNFYVSFFRIGLSMGLVVRVLHNFVNFDSEVKTKPKIYILFTKVAQLINYM